MSRRRPAELGAVIVAAGSGTRFGAVDKVFAPLDGRPVLEYALRLFSLERGFSAIVLVLGAHTLQRGAELVAALGSRDVTICRGGESRTASVRAGLASLDIDIELVAIHDAVRPLATPALLERTVAAAREHGAAVPVLPLADTIHALDDNGCIVQTLDRVRLRAAQTPQVVRRDWLEHALELGIDGTDDAGLLRAAGYTVLSVPGEADNLKLTWPRDLRVAEALLAAREARR